MPRQWTKAQEAAMNTKGRTLLISAAAGSGKTATLTQRIIRRLTDPEHPADLSRMLIVTFTRAAAAELRQRISDALSDAIAAAPQDRHLQQQLMDLGSAHISTIDAFCMEPIRAHFAEAGLPASFRIADAAELDPLSERVMDETIDLYYKKYAPEGPATDRLFSMLDGNPFADLCDALTPSRNDEGLPAVLRDLYDRLLTFPAGLAGLCRQAERMDAQADGDFLLSDHGRILAAWLSDFCSSAAHFYASATEILSSDDKASAAYGPTFAYEADFVAQLQGALSVGYAEVRTLLSTYAPPSLKPLRGAGEEIQTLKLRRTAYGDEIKKKFRDVYFADEPEKISDDIRKTAHMCRVLYDFLTAYDTRMATEKRQRGICDFADNRRYLLRMLTDAEGHPSALAEEYRKNFDEIYIDEYQDVDEVQDTIFRLIGGDHRFMVGDIKQSIYSFRGADPSVFAGYRTAFPALDPDAEEMPDPPAPGGGQSIFMSENFRCDESVIRVTNAVCGHVFRACPATVNYRPEDDLGFAKAPPYEGYVAPKVEIDLLYKDKPEEESPDEGDEEERPDASAEYIHVANRIAELLRSGERLANGEPITPGDIAILVRSKTGFSKLTSALVARGIPVGCEELDAARAGQNILHGADMIYLVDLLRVLDNPDSDVPLSEVLRAPFPGFSLEDVLAFRRSGNGSLYEGLTSYPTVEGAEPSLASRVREFVTWLEGYREACTTLSAEELLRLLRQDTRVAARHSKAFLYLYDAARTCRVGAFTGVYAFLRFFEKKLETTKDGPTEGNAKAGGYVSIMTIHHAKGLEFPVCFVIRCGASLGRESGADLLFEKQAGVGMKLFDRAEGRKYVTAPARASSLAIRLHDREDEMRVLYVAMTRARERLYLCGVGNETLPPPFAAGDRYATLSCGKYLNWITAAWQTYPHLAAFAHLNLLPLSSIRPSPPLPREAVARLNGEDQATAAYYRRLRDTAPVPTAMDARLRSVPTKVPASRMVPDMLDRCVFFASDLPVGDEDKLPESERGAAGCDSRTLASIRESIRLMQSSGRDEFELLLSEGRKPTAAERGTATHLFLQFCDYARVAPSGCEGGHAALTARLDDEIARLLDAGFINHRTAEIVDRRRLAAFFESDFYVSLPKDTRVRREFRFNRFLPLASLTQDPALKEALGDRTLYVQGSIDLLCECPDGRLLICDYKTDRITATEREDPARLALRMREKHGAQLTQYAEAVREIYGRTPDEVYIYSVPLGQAVRIDL